MISQPPHLRRSRTIIITVVIILILVIASGLWYWQWERGCYQGLVRCTVPVTPNEIDTSTWQTYRNEEYGFEFKYPEGFNIVSPKQNSYWITSNSDCLVVDDCHDYEVEFVFDFMGDTSPGKE